MAPGWAEPSKGGLPTGEHGRSSPSWNAHKLGIDTSDRSARGALDWGVVTMSSRRSNRTGRARRLAVLAAVPLLAALAVGCTKYGATLLRPEEPVVLDGSALPKLLGTTPQHV